MDKKFLVLIAAFLVVFSTSAYATSYEKNLNVTVSQSIFSYKENTSLLTQFINFSSFNLENLPYNSSVRVFNSFCGAGGSEIPSALLPWNQNSTGHVSYGLLVIKENGTVGSTITYCIKFNDTTTAIPTYPTDLNVQTNRISNSYLSDVMVNSGLNETRPLQADTGIWTYTGIRAADMLLINGSSMVTSLSSGSCVLKYNFSIAVMYNCSNAGYDMYHIYYANSFLKHMYHTAQNGNRSNIGFYMQPSGSSANKVAYDWNTTTTSTAYNDNKLLARGIVGGWGATTFGSFYMWTSATNASHNELNADVVNEWAGAFDASQSDNLRNILIARVWAKGSTDAEKVGNATSYWHGYVDTPIQYNLFNVTGNQAPTVNITSPTNKTYIAGFVLLNFSFIDADNTSAVCSRVLDGSNLNLGTINNNTVNVTVLNNLSHGAHTVSVFCWDGSNNATASVSFTTLHYNVTGETWDGNQTETNTTMSTLNVSVAENVQNLTVTLTYNNTAYTALKSVTGSAYSFNYSVIEPLIVNNGTFVNFNWTINITYNNGTNSIYLTTTHGVNLSWAFLILGLSQNNTQTAEGSYMNITANVSAYLPRVNSDRTVLFFVNITYNNTVNQTTFLYNTTGNYFFNFSFIAPMIPAPLDNQSFFYNATFYVSYGGITRQVQNYQYILWIDNVDFTSCTSGVFALNFSFFDERNPQNPVATGNSMEIDVKAWHVNNTFFGNFSFAMNDTTGFAICIKPAYTTLNVNATIIFRSNGYYQRSYYLVNAPLSAVTTNLSLYLLNTSFDGSVRVFLESIVGSPAPNLFVRAERYYAQNASTGAYRTVAIIRTADPLGDAFTSLEYTNAFYRFTVLRDNTVLKMFSNRQIEKDSLTDIYATVVLRLTEGTGEYYQYIKGTLVGYTCGHNNNTGIVTCTVQDTSGLLASALLNVTKKVSNTFVQVCSNSLTSTGGTVVCNVSSSGNGIYKYYLNVYTATNKYTQFTDTFQIGQNVALGAGGLVIALFIFLMMSFIFIYNFKIAIATGVLGLAASLLFTNSWELAGGFFISIAVIGGIFIVRGNK